MEAVPRASLRTRHVLLFYWYTGQWDRAQRLSAARPGRATTYFCACVAVLRSCSFDYKAAGKDKLSSQNPVVVAAKVHKI